MKIYKLNAQAIRKALKNYGIKVRRCVQGKGSLKNAALIVVDAAYVSETLNFFNEFGIVNSLGKAHRMPSTAYGVADFSACFMSETMYDEINS
jgi:hypothetical protein